MLKKGRMIPVVDARAKGERRKLGTTRDVDKSKADLKIYEIQENSS